VDGLPGAFVALIFWLHKKNRLLPVFLSQKIAASFSM
jgi:hypothetical protein